MSKPITRRDLIYTMLAGTAALQSADAAFAAPKGKTVRVYIGTYTNGASKGIYLYHLDTATGILTDTGIVIQAANPSFLALHPNRKFLYAVNEVENFGGKPEGAVTAFAVDAKTGALKMLNQQGSMGTSPCHLSVDAKGENVLTANYSSGSLAVLPIGADGKLAPHSAIIQHTGSSADTNRQTGPHAHSIYTEASGRFALAADLGTDKIYVYHYDAKHGKLTPNAFAAADLPPGSGPRHLAFSANRRCIYAISEMFSTVTVFEWNEKTGELETVQSVSTLPADFHGVSTTAEIALTPDGKFLYASNRGHDSLAIYSVNSQTGLLHSVGWQSTQGKTPRHFVIDPAGTLLLAANQDSDTVVVFRLAPETGLLTPTGSVAHIPAPVCVLLD